MSKRYVILGGGCSFALHLSKYLLRHDASDSILAIGRSSPKPSYFGGGINDPRYSYEKLHLIDDFDVLVSVLNNECPDTIVNFAAQGESSASFKESWRYFETNCVALSRLVEMLDGNGYLKRFIQIGASEAYGSVSRPSLETDNLNPTSPYAASKGAFDQYLMAMQRRSGFPANIVRPSNTYCEWQQLHRVIPRAFLFGLTGRRLPLYGAGAGQKSYIHAEDVARAIHLVSEHAPLGRIYNVAPREPISTRSLVVRIAKMLKLPESTLFEDVGMRRGTDARYWLDTCAIEHGLGWTQTVPIESGLERVHRWIRDNLAVLSGLPTEFAMRP